MSADRPGGTRMDLDPYDLHCEHCWQFYSLNDKQEFAKRYFKKHTLLRCRDCGGLIDWWTATLKSIRSKDDRTTMTEVCLSIEARKSIVETTLRAGRKTEIVFSDTGIPADAWILNINYNSTYRAPMTGGSMQAVEIYENPLTRRLNPSGATFYGIPNGDPPYPDANLTVSVTWAPNRPGDLSWEYLVMAFIHYIDDHFHAALLAASSSAEARLSKLITDYFGNIASQKNVEAFLRSRAGYGDQLNVLLPSLLRLTKAPQLFDKIRGALNRLRDLRNQIAHGRKAPDEITKGDAAEALCAAAFGVRYFDVVEPYLLRALAKTEKKREKKKKGKKRKK